MYSFVSGPQKSVHMIAATVGFISFYLLWMATIWGLVLRNGWMLVRIRHTTVYGIHQTVALLGLCLGVVHAFVQLAAPVGTVRVIDEFIPFTNPVDPIGIGVGLVGLELLLAVTGSVLVQRVLGYSRWRALHSLTYVAFMLLVAHLLISGSEVSGWVWGAVLSCWLATAMLWFTTTSTMATVHHGLSAMVARRRRQEITVNVDARRCERFGFCEHEAPDVFRLRGDGRLSYHATAPADRAHAVIRAVEVCPARAIALGQVPTMVITPPPAAQAGESGHHNGIGENGIGENIVNGSGVDESLAPHGSGNAGSLARTNGATVTGLHRRRGGR